ncbi:adenine/guanine phosphoribosyltransferase-like PRPP-binding protein [Sphingomonas endophytica]|uniref:Adenine/guanine phosphoribosyltransferase-like PRPP-binding protein n=1 Tax=Sphingomonas endophytica TaxID=869719 RepID=A0A7X0MQF1_9SPHN|nr:DUF3572 domain-containing protein [Sphingomonas endophytica]MBB6506045.1 adenine/guanine phosphoribosyltransferase-like PRPP-binding protein [Sphingomonas endophytica]
MVRNDTNPDDAVARALDALTFILNDPLRAGRFLDTTGLTADNLRKYLTDPSTLAATLTFLEAHEPDLIACAESTGHSPGSLVAARQVLEQTR